MQYGVRKTALAPCLKRGHGDGIAEIKASLAINHGKPQTVLRPKVGAHRLGKSFGFGAKNQKISRLKTCAEDIRLTTGCQGEHALAVRARIRHEGLPAAMRFELRVFVVVQPGASHVFVIHRKAQGLHQVQSAARVGRKPNGVAGVRWDFRLNQHNVKHAPIVAKRHSPPQAPWFSSVRAKTTALTALAPPARSVWAAEKMVAPVVITSSTRTTRLLLI